MLLRWIIDRTVSVLGFALSGRKVTAGPVSDDGKIKVNMGCGLAIAPGWINVDASLNALFGGAPSDVLRLLYRTTGASRYYSREDYCRLLGEHRFVFHDLGRSLPFHERSVDFFYSSHFFEHLFKKDAERLLRDCHRALRDGGVIRIAVPDLAYAVSLYQVGDVKKMLDDYFFVDDLSSYLARHKYMYDFELLAEALARAGFRDIKRCAYREGLTPDIDTLDNRPDETLFVEAVR
ncbi:class I SAM-dependent methyltransferase [Denitromonas iodatirespirans]|uniref:Methyltransferase domain-containing protein n=1 Tax=Denitromonas iodatirespirans TaxID=2795389 RepID=A0A944HDU5_DENI1|nr:methyltransferase domain-containing protein [Denitromonas iodatirespirans]MBT0962321.1 methyltransferase domain-containing protein [Denitromonas iodatirespirans]